MSLKESAGSSGARKVYSIVAALSTVALLLTAFTGSGGDQGAAQEAETVYRETAVERGDITVGVTETATATLKVHSLSFDIGSDISADVTEVFVKAGQTVQQGDAIATISAESISEEISELQSEYQEAALKLSEARLELETGVLDATTSYNSSIVESELADSTYDMTVEKLELAVEKIKKEIVEIETEIRTYTTLLRNYNSYSDAVVSMNDAKAWLEDAESSLKSYKELAQEYKSKMGDAFDEYSEEYQKYLARIENAEAEVYAAELEYNSRSRSYSNKYDNDYEDKDDIIEDQRDAYSRLEDAQQELREAEYNLETQKAKAGLTKEETLSKAELADTTYEMKLKQLENAVSSKQLAMENIQDQISKYSAYLSATTITAPCDGVVTAVNVSEGDTVQANTAVAGISDSSHVYVYISVAQDDITGVELGQECTVEMDAFEELSFPGVVDSITTTPVRSASGSASYNVTIRLEGDTAQVYEGMTGSATLITRQQKDVVYVSTRAVYTRDGGEYVKVRGDDGEVVEAAVKTGFSDGRNVEITEGLTQGQTALIESQVQAQ